MIGGDFLAIDGRDCRRVARLHPDGALDYSFNPAVGPDGAIYALSQDQAGNTYVGGAFHTFAAVSTNGVVKLHSNGSLDVHFDSPLGASVYGISPPDGAGRIVVAGAMGYKVARLNGRTGAFDLDFNYELSGLTASFAR